MKDLVSKLAVTLLLVSLAVGCGKAKVAEPEHTLENSRVLFTEGKINEALAELQKVLEKNPANDKAFVLLGDIYASQNELPRAAASLLNAVNVNPNNIDAYNRLGILHNQQGDHELAMRYFTKAVQVDPNNAQAYYNLGTLVLQAGQLEAAVGFYQKVLELDPSNEGAREMLSKISALATKALDEEAAEEVPVPQPVI